MNRYRPGSIGALLDEYERALAECQHILREIPSSQFRVILDDLTSDEHGRSVPTIIGHMIASGYLYADYIRRYFGLSMSSPPDAPPESSEAAINGVHEMFQYTLDSLAGRMDMIDEEIEKAVIKTSWATYDLEQLLEHAIVHVLRHNRQIQKLREQPRRKWGGGT